MRSKIKIAFLVGMLFLWLCSCELVELTQRDEVSISAHSTCDEVRFTVSNIGKKGLENVCWTADVYDTDNNLLWDDSGRIGYLPFDQNYPESTQINSCFDSNVHCVRITVTWDNKKGNSCYEWETIYL